MIESKGYTDSCRRRDRFVFLFYLIVLSTSSVISFHSFSRVRFEVVSKVDLKLKMPVK